MSDKRTEILQRVNEVSTQELVALLRQGDVAVAELREAGFSNERIAELRQVVAQEDAVAWQGAMSADTCEAYTNYMREFPKGSHAIDCTKRLGEKDEELWIETKTALSEDSIKKYLSVFPSGAHSMECEVILNDAEWLKVLKTATLEAFEQYRAKYPERHVREVSEEIARLSDDKDWADVQKTLTMESMQHYVLNHPAGKHLDEARKWINDFTLKGETLENLAKDPNYCSAKQLQEYVKNKIMTKEDLLRIYSPRKVEAILSYESPVALPASYPPEELEKGRAEVYFWGTPSSGKTSAIGAALCCAHKSDILTLRESQGVDYMLRLTTLFVEDEVCAFPTNTQSNSIYEMQLSLRDSKKKEHELTLIDLAGEVFRAIYEKQAGLIVSDEATVDTTMNYVLDQKNEKIHFFVVEYGKHYSDWHGVRMDNYLDACANFLVKNKILRKSTNAVYILVTKTDKIQCAPEERPRKAYEYIKEYYPSFYNGLELACQQAGIGDYGVIAFSIGDVFAQQMCLFDETCAWKIINKLLLKTSATKKGWWSILTQ